MEIKDVAKEIRTLLKNTFPNTKFSVKCHHFSQGEAVAISWADGPTKNQVDTLVNKYGDGYSRYIRTSRTHSSVSAPEPKLTEVLTETAPQSQESVPAATIEPEQLATPITAPEQAIKVKVFYSRDDLNDYLGYPMSQLGKNAVKNIANNVYESNPWLLYQTKDGKKIKYYPESGKYQVFEADDDYHASKVLSNKLLRDTETGRPFGDYDRPDRYTFARRESVTISELKVNELQALHTERSVVLGQYVAFLREASALESKAKDKRKEAQVFRQKMKEIDKQIEAEKSEIATTKQVTA